MKTKVLIRQKDGQPILFFPDYIAPRGQVACWMPEGGHGKATLEYYRATTAAQCPLSRGYMRIYQECFSCELQPIPEMPSRRKALPHPPEPRPVIVQDRRFKSYAAALASPDVQAANILSAIFPDGSAWCDDIEDGRTLVHYNPLHCAQLAEDCYIYTLGGLQALSAVVSSTDGELARLELLNLYSDGLERIAAPPPL